MQNKKKQPLMRPTHLPLFILGTVMAVYGLLTAMVGNWYANQAMQGDITAAQYRSQLAAFDRAAGLVAGILLLALFIWCAVVSKGIVRAAFGIGALSAFAPILAPRAENLLFATLGLPTMSAGSVLAGAVSTFVYALPLVILFLLLSLGRHVLRSCRWISLISIFVVLFVAFYPIYVTLLAFLLKPGDPAVGRMIETSSQVIELRYVLPGLSFLLLAWINNNFAGKQKETGEQPAANLAES